MATEKYTSDVSRLREKLEETEDLSDTEWIVFESALEGDDPEETARKADITKNTASTYRSKLTGKDIMENVGSRRKPEYVPGEKLEEPTEDKYSHSSGFENQRLQGVINNQIAEALNYTFEGRSKNSLLGIGRQDNWDDLKSRLSSEENDKDQIYNILEENNGEISQAEITRQVDWSESKVSYVLSEMAENGDVDKVTVGRENYISYSEEDDEHYTDTSASQTVSEQSSHTKANNQSPNSESKEKLERIRSARNKASSKETDQDQKSNQVNNKDEDSEIQEFSSWQNEETGSGSEGSVFTGNANKEKSLILKNSYKAKRELKELYSAIKSSEFYIEMDTGIAPLKTVDDISVTEKNMEPMMERFNHELDNLEFGPWEYRETNEEGYAVINGQNGEIEVDLEADVPNGYDENSIAVYTQRPEPELIGAFTSRDGIGEMIDKMR